MPLVINGLGGGHTDRYTDTHTHQSNFKKPGARGLWPCAPGLKRVKYLIYFDSLLQAFPELYRPIIIV